MCFFGVFSLIFPVFQEEVFPPNPAGWWLLQPELLQGWEDLQRTQRNHIPGLLYGCCSGKLSDVPQLTPSDLASINTLTFYGISWVHVEFQKPWNTISYVFIFINKLEHKLKLATGDQCWNVSPCNTGTLPRPSSSYRAETWALSSTPSLSKVILYCWLSAAETRWMQMSYIHALYCRLAINTTC